MGDLLYLAQVIEVEFAEHGSLRIVLLEKDRSCPYIQDRSDIRATANEGAP
jgi:hypothetical protein